MKICAFAVALVFSLVPVFSEVEQVTVRWKKELCQESCINLLNKKFTELEGVSDFTFSENDGEGTLYWKPTARFAFAPIDHAFRRVGIRLKETRVLVQGTLEVVGQDIILRSLGDETDFVLVNPVQPSEGGYTVTKNLSQRRLSPELKEKLLEAQKNDQMVTVEGPLFQPYRPPLHLVVEKFRISR